MNTKAWTPIHAEFLISSLETTQNSSFHEQTYGMLPPDFALK